MHMFAKLAAAAAFAGLAVTAAPAVAQTATASVTTAATATAQGYGRQRGYEPHHRGGRWNGPEGHFMVYARTCPDLREDRRDRRYDTGWRDRREDRRDRRVIDCPDRSWEYVPSRRELRQGRTGERLRPDRAYLDRRTGEFFVETRWCAAVTVGIIMQGAAAGIGIIMIAGADGAMAEAVTRPR